MDTMDEVYFQVPDIFAKISEILAKNGIKESPEDAALKEGLSFIGIVFNLAKDIAKEKVTEKDFCLSLQTQLKVSQKASENILKDVKEKILPFAEKIKIGGNTDEKEGNFTEIKPPMGLPKIGEAISEPRTNVPTAKKMRNNFQSEKQENQKKIFEKSPNLEPKASPKKQDTYREPIE